jgi:hypothetical protein
MHDPGADFRVTDTVEPKNAGMSLRDYFAAKAMQGLLSNPELAGEILKNGVERGFWIEESAYAWADGMIAEREKGVRS